ncbi:MAG TPA: hypothetical protein VHT04_15295 [Stellaceae bacterium]|jgi:cytochrome c556|nr:hypothetical protein [Stellaceae bacterium]
MRTVVTSLSLSIVMIAATPVIVVAASGLRGIMHNWRADARTTRDILSGRGTFDEATIREVLQGYVADAERIGAQVTGNTAAARDFKQRFMTFQTDAQKALGDLAQRPALQADFSRLMSDCQSCHDAFKD